MSKKKVTYEFWCEDQFGIRHHNFHTTTKTTDRDIKKEIEVKHNIDLAKTEDFGMEELKDF